MVVARRLKLGVAALVAFAASAFFAAPALADTQPDPQLTNIPYLAWRGEEVRLVKCEPDVFPIDMAGTDVARSVQFGATFIDVLLVDWSGDPLAVRPQLEPGTVSVFFRSFDGAPCVAATVVSQKPGLAQFKLVATVNISQAIGFPFPFPEVITLKHDFNVAWMNINQAVLNPLDPLTDVAGGPANELQVIVNGTIPLLGNYAELGLGSELLMPNDWPRLAQAIATHRDPLNPGPASLWDIHDEYSPAGTSEATPAGTGATLEGHGAQSECPSPAVLTFFDAGDDCGFANPFGQFSRVWDDFTFPTLGPFDQQRPSQTYLSNGVLDSGDAPMPAARVDWTIAQNTGAPGDISGVGSLFPQLKFLAYVRDTAHPFFAPFYAFWVPPAYPSILSALFGPSPPAIVPEASGVTGPANLARDPDECNGSVLANGIAAGGGNNFNGFLACGLYVPWLFARTLQCGPGGFNADPSDPFGLGCEPTALGATGCLPLVAGEFEPPLTGADIPFGAQTAAAYTDEHGEARVFFVPGVNFFFLNLPGVAINSNQGCDIANIPGGILGTANVSAVVRYPFEPVTARPVVSNTLTKTVLSRFEKSITCYPKGTQPEEQNAAICVARALDITGAPFVRETVCFMADFNAEDIQAFPQTGFGTATITTATPPLVVGIPGEDVRNEAEEATGLRRICMLTDLNGRAAVEIFNTNPTTVDVQAFFKDEGILRHILVQFPITGQVGPATGVRAAAGSPAPSGTSNPPSGTTPSGSQPSGTQPSGQQPSGQQPSGARPTTSKPAVKRTVRVMKVKRVTRTRAVVVLKVSGPAGKAKVRIRIAGNGRAMLRVVTVNANKVATVRGLKTPNAKRLRVSASVIS